MQEETKHSPTPWVAKMDILGRITIYPEIGGIPWIAELYHAEKDLHYRNPESEANCAYIIKCVNSHEALVKALEKMLKRATLCDPFTEAEAKAALELAKGE